MIKSRYTQNLHKTALGHHPTTIDLKSVPRGLLVRLNGLPVFLPDYITYQITRYFMESKSRAKAFDH